MTKSQPRAALIFGCLAIALAVVIEQIVIAGVNGWWADELFALWASDPAIGFGELFRARIATDSNPPLYFSLLHVARLLMSDHRTAVIGLNAALLAVGFAGVMVAAWRTSSRRWVALAFAVFALGGPAAAYLPEARAYCLALTVSFVAVVLTLLMTTEQNSRAASWPFVLIGMIAGLSHLFAALLCCALAAASFAVNLGSKRRDAIASSLALGASAVLSTLIWMLLWMRLGPGDLGQVSWIPFTASFVWEAGLGALGLTYGVAWLVIGAAMLVLFGLCDPRSRRPALVMALAATLFVVVPILISFRVPIILTRYWLVGSPLFLAALALMMGRWRRGSGSGMLAIGAAAFFIAVSVPWSFRAGYAFVAAKPVWRGIGIVAPRLAGCGPQSVHVLGFTPGFSIATGAPPQTFVDVRSLDAGSRSLDASCPILGWSEHYVLRFGPTYMSRATAAELLQLLKLDVAPNDVTIDRSESGFVVRRKS